MIQRIRTPCQGTMGTLLLMALTLAASPIAPVQAEDAKKVFILGIDGMDPNLLDKFVEEGAMPNFKKLIEEGDYKRLQTTMPALSPVAWSTFITGQDPGGHGIFDFIHRKAETLEPFMSTSEVLPPGKTLEFGTRV
ncbi:alkaline phosphatase family protein, partial [Candidatus Sumerlaeota bacterium]|nr:alkaline phosphatase family protein [Candidatus Sumerlaeota bacterium]